MDELTNQSDDLELDLGLGSDEEPEGENEETEETDVSEEAPEETPDTFELGIRYNGQDMKLSRDEATTLAQKGMNYDKVYQQLQDLRNDPIRKVFEEQAAEAGLTLQEYAQRMQDFRQQVSIRNIADAFKKENPDVTDDIAQKYAEQAYANQKAKIEADNRARTQQAESDRNQALIKEVQAFNEHFPDVKIEDLPAEVIDDINAGTKLETAYLRYQNRELQKRLSNSETNAKNKQKNIGSASDNMGGSGEEDPFLKGLFG